MNSEITILAFLALTASSLGYKWIASGLFWYALVGYILEYWWKKK